MSFILVLGSTIAMTAFSSRAARTQPGAVRVLGDPIAKPGATRTQPAITTACGERGKRDMKIGALFRQVAPRWGGKIMQSRYIRTRRSRRAQ